MKRALLVLVIAIPSLLALFVVVRLGLNYVRADTRGTVPIERLARRGSELERAVTRAVADSLAVGRYSRGTEWYARRERSANGDTIFFRIYRAEDARPVVRMLQPDPHVVGGAFYVISERRLRVMGIGVS